MNEKRTHFPKMPCKKNAQGLTLSGPDVPERPKGAKDEVKRPEGPPAKSRGPEGPQTLSCGIYMRNEYFKNIRKTLTVKGN